MSPYDHFKKGTYLMDFSLVDLEDREEQDKTISLRYLNALAQPYNIRGFYGEDVDPVIYLVSTDASAFKDNLISMVNDNLEMLCTLCDRYCFISILHNAWFSSDPSIKRSIIIKISATKNIEELRPYVKFLIFALERTGVVPIVQLKFGNSFVGDYFSDNEDTREFYEYLKALVSLFKEHNYSLKNTRMLLRANNYGRVYLISKIIATLHRVNPAYKDLVL